MEPEALAGLVEDVGGASADATHDNAQRQIGEALTNLGQFLAESIAPRAHRVANIDQFHFLPLIVRGSRRGDRVEMRLPARIELSVMKRTIEARTGPMKPSR
ncbi:hypothetical protein D3C86_1980950 [compost metagenome]